MLPLADHNPRQTTPVVNIILIAVNVLVFLWEISLGPEIGQALFDVAFVPARFWFLPGALLPNIITIQIFFGAASMSGDLQSAGGVAYFAHIGGFVAGMVLILLLGGRRSPTRPVYVDYWRR